MKSNAFVVVVALVSGLSILRAEEAAKSPAAPAPKATAAPAAAAAPAPATASAGLKVDKIVVGTGIDNKEIAGEAAQFPGSVTRVYCWTKVTADSVPTTLKHVWTADGKKEAEVSLDVKYPSTRTWSSKSVWPGAWKVEAVDGQGTVLASKEFTVTKDSAPVGQ